MTVRLFLASIALAACGGGDGSPADAASELGADAPTPVADAAPDAFIPAAVGQFPEGFLWGTAIAPYQVEGNLHDTDWYVWEGCGLCSPDHADDGPDFWDHFDEDFANAEAMGTNAIRLGIEWGRVFPTAASFPDHPDPDALAHYHAIVSSARAHGLVVMVTLHHFSTPLWLADPRVTDQPFGWDRDDMPQLFAAWAGFCAREFDADVDWWITINEPFAMIAAGWMGPLFPPGHFADVSGAVLAEQHMVRAHVLAYEAIHANDAVSALGDGVAARVSFAAHNRVFLPEDPTNPDDARAAAATTELNNRSFLDAVVNGDVDANLDGDFDDAGDTRGDPTLAGHLDYVGLNYYGVSLVRDAGQTLFPFVGAPAANDLDRFGVNLPITEYGATIYPQGFRVVLDEVARYALPIVITENGIADGFDTQRPRFLVDHLYALAKAIDEGVDVRGYFHWSLIDNFEWAAGFCPQFGLYHVDRADAARARSAGEGVDVYRRIIEAGTVPVAMFGEFPAYGVPGKYCFRTGL